MKLIYVSRTGRGNGLETKRTIQYTAFLAQEVFQLTIEQESLKGEYFL
jgi:hypothetical protein